MQFQSTTCASLTDPEPVSPTAYFNHGIRCTGHTLISIDESRQHYQRPAKSGDYIAQRRLVASNGINSGIPLQEGSQVCSPESSACHKRGKSFTEPTKLNIRLGQCLTRSADHSGSASYATWSSCPSTADEILVLAASSHNDGFVHNSNLDYFRSSRSPEAWILGNEDPHESARQSGCLWDDLDLYGSQEPVGNSHVNFFWYWGALWEQ